MSAARPQQSTGATSVARILDDWYVLCRSTELRAKPIRRVLFGSPLVLFRSSEGVAACLDRCPHRNATLSRGRLVDGRLECGYHGWQFDRGGICRRVPSLCGEQEGRARQVPAYPCHEQDGFVWVYATPNVQPERQPYRFPLLDQRSYTHVYQTTEAAGSLHAVAENALDVPHTAFLHQGLFRGTGKVNRIEAVVRRWHDRAEAEYLGEPIPPGVAGRIPAPGESGTVAHFDRFILPCLAQVDYRLGARSHFCVTTALTPVDDFHTRLFAILSFKLPIPGWLVKLLLTPIGRWIFAQDASMLAAQSETIARFGGEQYVSTEVDTLGPHILRLLRNAERGQREPGELFEKRVTLEV